MKVFGALLILILASGCATPASLGGYDPSKVPRYNYSEPVKAEPAQASYGPFINDSSLKPKEPSPQEIYAKALADEREAREREQEREREFQREENRKNRMSMALMMMGQSMQHNQIEPVYLQAPSNYQPPPVRAPINCTTTKDFIGTLHTTCY